jgi:hypothetical protein
MREWREVLQQQHGMQCKNNSTTPSGRDMMLIGVIIASFRPIILHEDLSVFGTKDPLRRALPTAC